MYFQFLTKLLKQCLSQSGISVVVSFGAAHGMTDSPVTPVIETSLVQSTYPAFDSSEDVLMIQKHSGSEISMSPKEANIRNAVVTIHTIHPGRNEAN